MKAEHTFLVVIAAACVIRHVLELLYVAFAKSDDLSRHYCNETRTDLATTHGLSTLVYIVTIAAFVGGVPEVGGMAVSVTTFGEWFVYDARCPSIQK